MAATPSRGIDRFPARSIGPLAGLAVVPNFVSSQEKRQISAAERGSLPTVPAQTSVINHMPPVMLIAKGNHMANRLVLATLATMLSVGVFQEAVAQDAAETAIILGGVGHAQRGASSLGAAISQSFNNAGNAFRAPSARTVSHRPVSAAARSRAAHAVPVVEESGDPFEGTNAPIYRLGNGASISASGGLTPEPNVRCVRDCPAAR